MFNQIGQNKSISQQVEDQLTKAIVNGKYEPGSKIPTENELCAIFNVSRTTIREAVKKMSARGIVEVKRGSGVFVSKMNFNKTSEILNLFFELSVNEEAVLKTIDARMIIEPIIAIEAAKHRSKEKLALLEKNIIDLKECDINNKKKEAELDNEFHKLLLSIVNNEVVTMLFTPIYSLMPKFKKNVFAKPVNGDLVKIKNVLINHHVEIFEAIKVQDKERAYIAMKNHLKETKKNYLKFNK